MINIIAAMAKNRVIGCDNKLPWRIADDLKNFKKLTSGNVVIMGRKTFESIGKPLPNRINVVISSSMPPTDGIIVCKSVDEAIQKAKTYGKEIFIIGGAAVYEQTIPIADKMYLSYVKGDYQGDALFPEFDDSKWKIDHKEKFPEFELVVYVKK
ncbi:MAG: dihydrofolate reductase [Candidatus Woesearchaeota archaeon]